MKSETQAVKKILRGLSPADPPGGLTQQVMDRIADEPGDSPPETLALVFFVAGFFFFCLFAVLAAGVRSWTMQGMEMEGLNLLRDAAFLIALLMGGAGFGLVRGGKAGVRTAYTAGLSTAAGCILSSIALSIKLASLSAAMIVLGYGLCGAAIALILLKELRRNENYGYK